jgi:hypothetical protein
MGLNASRRIKKIINEAREWLAERPPRLEDEFSDLDMALSQRSLGGLRSAALTLGVLGVYFGRLGSIRVIDGDPAGWKDIGSAVGCHFWNLRILSESFFRMATLDPVGGVLNLTSNLSSAACLSSFYLVHGNSKREEYTRDLLFRAATVPGIVDESFWQRRVFEPFVLWLGRKQDGGGVLGGFDWPDFGAYAPVVDHWDDPEKLGEPIFGACEYHCMNMDDYGRDWKYEFLDAPFDLLPYEVLAIYAVRRNLGLPTPTVDHPLLATPLSTLESHAAPENDAILSRVESVFESIFGKQ